RMSGRGAVDAIQTAIREADDVLFFLNRTKRLVANAMFAVGQQLPSQLRRVGFGKKIVRAKQPAFAIVEDVLAELGEGEQRRVAVNDRFADTPKDLHLALPVIAAVAVGHTHWEAMPLGRPGAAVIVGIAIAVPAEHVGPSRLAVERVNVVAVVVVEG